MKLYNRHPVYALSHIAFGFAAVWFPLIGVLAVVYQLYQYFGNIRIFPIEGVVKQGNSFAHTSLKLLEIALGYAIGYTVKPYLR